MSFFHLLVIMAWGNKNLLVSLRLKWKARSL